MKEIPAPIEALDESKLEEISGGSNLYGAGEFAILSNQGQLLGQQLLAILAPLFINIIVEKINASNLKAQYADTMSTLSTYDKSTASMEQKSTFFAQSWTNHHPGETMTPEIAELILGIKDPLGRAIIASADNMNDVITGLKKVYSQ